MSDSKSVFPWYQEGLSFSCTQCGKCCTGSPGYVWVNEQEMADMAQFLGMALADFKRLYVKRLHNRHLLVEKKSQNHDCVFYKQRRCLVYEARPLQCRSYPFWKENLLSPTSWEQTAQVCEGICSDAPRIACETIQQIIEQQGHSNEHYVPATLEKNSKLKSGKLPTRSIQAFFWDYDNTILETAEAHWNKHQVVLARYGIKLSEGLRKRVYENNGSQNWEWMKDELGLKVSQKDYLEEVDWEFQQNIANLEMRPGIAQLFKVIDDLGIPQAIITNARRDSAEPILKQKKILPLMRFVLFKEDYVGRKPDPTPYLVGFKRMADILGIAIIPQRCIAVEDDPKGVQSAREAGAVVIHRKLKENEADSPHAHHCCFHESDFVKIVRDLLDSHTSS